MGLMDLPPTLLGLLGVDDIPDECQPDCNTNDIPDQTGKIAVITGANSGTGFQATRTLLSKGARVVMLNRSAERSDAAIAKLQTPETERSPQVAGFAAASDSVTTPAEALIDGSTLAAPRCA